MSGRSFPQGSVIAFITVQIQINKKNHYQIYDIWDIFLKNCGIPVYELYLLCQRFRYMTDVLYLEQFSLGQTVLLACY